MLPLTRSRNRSRFFPPFSPASLFSAGEQGAWYDPSDLTTLFTDSAGTTPVTAVEQFVGLMLDKSKGLVLGPELVSNPGPNFVNTTGWTGQVNVTLSVDSGQLKSVLSSTSNTATYASITTVAGTRYKVTYVISGSTGTVVIQVYNGAFVTLIEQASTTGDGTFKTVTLTFVALSTNTRILHGAGVASTILVSSVTVRELPGNHATSTGTKRPKLAARYNLLTYTEQFDNGVWTKNTSPGITSNAAIAPNGTLTADLIYPTINGNYVGVYQNAGSVNSARTARIYAKAAGKNVVGFVDFGGGTVAGYVNLQTGAVSNVLAGYTITATLDNNGFYLITITLASGGAFSYLQIYVADAAGSIAVTANGTDGVLVWGADLRPASQATGLIGPTYQRVVDAATYDTAGFLPYLQFDGIDDEMTITTLSTLITASEYEACVGARVIQSNTNTATVYLNNQIMGDGGQYFSVGYVRNTVNVIGAYNWDGNQDETNQPLTPPATTVLQQWHQGGNLSLSLNGGATTSVASGNTLSLTGTVSLGKGGESGPPWLVWNCYGVLLRNAALTSAQRASMLAWMNGKTGAF